MAKRKKKKKPETGMDRLKSMPLWQWGLITIFGGVFANVVMMTVQGPTGSSAAERGQALGRAVGTVFFIVVGIVLIIVDLVRRR